MFLITGGRFLISKYNSLLVFQARITVKNVLSGPPLKGHPLLNEWIPWVPEVFLAAAGILGVGRRPTLLRP